jgi:hypothetical protein
MSTSPQTTQPSRAARRALIFAVIPLVLTIATLVLAWLLELIPGNGPYSVASLLSVVFLLVGRLAFVVFLVLAVVSIVIGLRETSAGMTGRPLVIAAIVLCAIELVLVGSYLFSSL